MSADVIDLDAHRPHRVMHMACRRCGKHAISVHPVAADISRLQCIRCGAQDSTWCERDACPTCAAIQEGT